VGTRKIVRAALIAAIYVLLVYLFAGFSFGIFQFRPAEALTLLPILYPEAVPALFYSSDAEQYPRGSRTMGYLWW